MFSHSSVNSFERVHLTFSVLGNGEGGAAVFPLCASSVQFGSCQLVVEQRVVVLLYQLLCLRSLEVPDTCETNRAPHGMVLFWACVGTFCVFDI